MRSLISAMLITIFNSMAWAQLSINSVSTAYTITFDVNLSGVNNNQFAAAGFAPSPSNGQLDSDAWASRVTSTDNFTFGDSPAGVNFARGNSNGNESTGGVYSFLVGSGDRALGIQPTGSLFQSSTLGYSLRGLGSQQRG
jgi:hypothetical protein